ncbi:unnamed protein product [Onchocerca ochengi]|uniref:CPW_WPC domain-containing protein n=1 Tax=Onchocerca ochengi TaxID=42157 RepID=A0A182ELK4_ONCOC|nr:unnamed protein product [Onchocerca ochengi]
MVAILSEFLISAILIHTIIAANEVFDKEIPNKLEQAEKNEHPSLLDNNYNKRMNYALMGGLYGRKPPFHGGIYGKRQSLPSSKYYSKQLHSPEIMHNEEFALPIYYGNDGKFEQLPYKFGRKYQFDEDDKNIVCIPPSIPAKDMEDNECCKLPPEIFPHKTIYEEFCSVLYFGTMANGPDGPFCRLSSSQERKSTACESGWMAFYEGINQFCYKAFTIDSKSAIDIMNKTDGDPCRKHKKTASLVRIPNQSINMFLYDSTAVYLVFD